MRFKPIEMPENVEQTFGATNPGYYIYVEGGRSPTVKHPNRFRAEAEARRLAGLLPGRDVHVLKVKASYHNLLERPIESNKLNREERLTANYARQIAARTGIEPGKIVFVVPSHHRFAGQMGYVDHLGDAPDASVYVKLVHSAGAIERFSPTSLTLQAPAKLMDMPVEKPEREPRCGDIVHYVERGVERQGEIKHVFADAAGKAGSFRIRDIIDNIVMPRAYTRDEFVVQTPVSDRPIDPAKACDQKTRTERDAPEEVADVVANFLGGILARAALRRLGIPSEAIDRAVKAKDDIDAGPRNPEKAGTALPLNSDVYIISDAGFGPIGVASPGKLVSYDDDDRFVWVLPKNRDGSFETERIKVNQSRVISTNDPAFRVINEPADA